MSGGTPNLSDLPPWSQIAANFGVLLVSVGVSVYFFLKKKFTPTEEAHEVVVESAQQHSQAASVERTAMDYILLARQNEMLSEIVALLRQEFEARRLERAMTTSRRRRQAAASEDPS